MTADARQLLNDVQLRTLRWIADGCPVGVMTGSGHKVSAVALQHRRLLRIDRRRGTWSAAITTAGTYYLEHGAYPPEASAAPPTANRTPLAHDLDRTALPSVSPPSSPARKSRVEQKGEGQSPGRRAGPTEAMVATLLQNDRRLEIALADADRYAHLARAATRFKKVPDGTRVRVERDWRERKARVILEDLPAWMTATLAPVEVAATLRQPTDVVLQLRGREDLGIRAGELNRALRLVDALVREARRRGYRVEVTEAAPRTDRWGYVERHEGNRSHFAIAIGPDHFQLSVRQEQEKVPHTPTKAEETRTARGDSFVPKFDLVPTPHLRLTIEGNDSPFRRSSWSDEPGGPLEAALAQVLQELELRHERAAQRRREAERQGEERPRRWSAARAAAVEQLVQAHRAEALKAQVRDWAFANRVRAYLAALEARLDDGADPQERESAARWIGWARDYAERLDPLYATATMPENPEPTAEALAPFMKGWSPYGPD